MGYMLEFWKLLSTEHPSLFGEQNRIGYKSVLYHHKCYAPVLDLSGHCHESLLNIGGVLCASLQKLHANLVCKGLPRPKWFTSSSLYSSIGVGFFKISHDQELPLLISFLERPWPPFSFFDISVAFSTSLSWNTDWQRNEIGYTSISCVQ